MEENITAAGKKRRRSPAERKQCSNRYKRLFSGYKTLNAIMSERAISRREASPENPNEEKKQVADESIGAWANKPLIDFESKSHPHPEIDDHSKSSSGEKPHAQAWRQWGGEHRLAESQTIHKDAFALSFNVNEQGDPTILPTQGANKQTRLTESPEFKEVSNSSPEESSQQVGIHPEEVAMSQCSNLSSGTKTRILRQSSQTYLNMTLSSASKQGNRRSESKPPLHRLGIEARHKQYEKERRQFSKRKKQTYLTLLKSAASVNNSQSYNRAGSDLDSIADLHQHSPLDNDIQQSPPDKDKISPATPQPQTLQNEQTPLHVLSEGEGFIPLQSSPPVSRFIIESRSQEVSLKNKGKEDLRVETYAGDYLRRTPEAEPSPLYDTIKKEKNEQVLAAGVDVGVQVDLLNQQPSNNQPGSASKDEEEKESVHLRSDYHSVTSLEKTPSPLGSDIDIMVYEPDQSATKFSLHDELIESLQQTLVEKDSEVSVAQNQLQVLEHNFGVIREILKAHVKIDIGDGKTRKLNANQTKRISSKISKKNDLIAQQRAQIDYLQRLVVRQNEEKIMSGAKSPPTASRISAKSQYTYNTLTTIRNVEVLEQSMKTSQDGHESLPLSTKQSTLKHSTVKQNSPPLTVKRKGDTIISKSNSKAHLSFDQKLELLPQHRLRQDQN